MFGNFSPMMPVKQQNVVVDFSKSVMTNEGMLKSQLQSFEALQTNDAFELVSLHLSEILDLIFLQKDQYALKLFTTKKFLITLNMVLHQQQLSNTQTQRCNKLIYDYIVRGDSDKEISNMMMEVSKQLNKAILPRLYGLGLQTQLCVTLAIARNSSEKEVINVRRLNKVIMSQPIKVMTEQMIVDIYCVFFNKALDLFEGVMYDIASCQNLGTNEIEIYGTISLAILDIVNELPLNMIYELLKRFSDNKQMIYPDNRIRFNIESFSPQDYPRLMSAIEKVKADGIYIPTT